MFAIGVGPSSSHTVGPMKAGLEFANSLQGQGVLDQVSSLEAHLYGSLALTGEGHGTFLALINGLAGQHPRTIDPDSIYSRVDEIKKTKILLLAGIHQIPFDYARDLKIHKDKFKNDKLIDLIHPSIGYHFSKLYENIHRDYDLVQINFNSIFETYNNIKQGITERYSSLSALSGVELTTETLDYLFARLKRDLIENKIVDKMELHIFIDALKSHFDELKSMIIEIDEEFSS